MLLDVRLHPFSGTVLRTVLRCDRQSSICVHPVAILEGVSSFLVAFLKLSFEVLSRAHKIMVVQKHMFVSLRQQTLGCLLTEVSVLNEGANLNVLSIDVRLDRVARVQIKTVDVNRLLKAFVHCDGFDLTSKFLRSFRKHHIKPICQQNLSIIHIA